MNVRRAEIFPQGYASDCFTQVDIFRYIFVMLSEAKHLG